MPLPGQSRTETAQATLHRGSRSSRGRLPRAWGAGRLRGRGAFLRCPPPAWVRTAPFGRGRGPEGGPLRDGVMPTEPALRYLHASEEEGHGGTQAHN